MTLDRRMEALERELHAERLYAIRARLVFGAYALLILVPQYRSSFHCMNVELPFASQLLLGAADFIREWWWLVLPSAWMAWRVVEDRALKTAPRWALRAIAVAFTAAIILAFQLMAMPWMRLINNVG